MGASQGEVRAAVDQRRWALQPGDVPGVHQAPAQVHKRYGEAGQGQQGGPGAAIVELGGGSKTLQVLEIREEVRPAGEAAGLGRL